MFHNNIVKISEILNKFEQVELVENLHPIQTIYPIYFAYFSMQPFYSKDKWKHFLNQWPE